MLRCYICNRPIDIPTKKECTLCRYEIDKLVGKISAKTSYEEYYDNALVEYIEKTVGVEDDRKLHN